MILRRFTDHFSELTDIEKKIAESIIERPENFINHSVSDIADKLYVSKTSIINFAQKMGFRGFTDLRYFLKSEIENETKSKKLNAFNEVNHHLSLEMEKTFELLREKDLKAFCNQIKKSSIVYVLARGITKQYATAFTIQLRTMNIIAIFVNDYNLIKSLPSTITQDATVLIISLSGKTDILVEFTNRVMAKKCKIMSITSFGYNPINQMSDFYLNFYSNTIEEKYRELDSRMGMHIVLQQVVEHLKLQKEGEFL